MGKYLEIRWQGQAGQGVMTAAELLAEILAQEGKYVQAFPEFITQKQASSIQAFNRLSDFPIKRHAGLINADVVVLMDARLLLDVSVKKNTADNASYVVNTYFTPDYVREKLNLSEANPIYTLDADTIANEEIGRLLPNIPLMTVVLEATHLITMGNFRESLKKTLSQKYNPELAAANIRTVERALSEVKRL
ncbi:MAG: pyruvate ferredoxin oxidoreductase gamma subunit [Acidobacteriota bacterium]|nr:pyruvate ferredoxin oxidoreductase gamma subunit [Acidobacteriota bacterium]